MLCQTDSQRLVRNARVVFLWLLKCDERHEAKQTASERVNGLWSKHHTVPYP